VRRSPTDSTWTSSTRGNEILAAEFVFHLPDEDVEGADGARELATLFRAAFPDVRKVHEDAIATPDKVAIRWTALDTHRGNYFPPWNTPPTGKPIHLRGIDWCHIRNGKIEEAWLEADELGALLQIGAVAAPPMTEDDA
jgi:predicted ester cyclase